MGSPASGKEDGPEVGVVAFGPFTFDSRRHELRRHGHRISMSASQMRLLTLFLGRAGDLVTREEIAGRLWADTRTIDVETGINTAVNRLRRTLQECPGGATPIETVIGLGYRFLPNLVAPTLLHEAVAESHRTSGVLPLGASQQLPSASADTIAGEDREAAAQEIQSESAHPQLLSVAPRRAEQRLFQAAGALCILLLLAGLGFWAFRRAASPTQSAPAMQATVQSALPPPLVQLTAEYEVGKLTAAAVSPTGQMVAYADPYGVSVYSFATSQTHLLVPRPSFTVDRLSWAPDERSMLMSGTDETSHQQLVWYVPLGGYARLVLADASRAVLSPDGNVVVFTRADARELWQAAANGQDPRLLRTAEAGERFGLVLWSPAGDRLLVTVHDEKLPSVKESPPSNSKQVAYEYLDAATGHVLHRQNGLAAASGYLLRNGDFFFVDGSKVSSDPETATIMMVPLDLNSGELLGSPHRVREMERSQADSISASLSGARTAALMETSDVDAFVANLEISGPQLSHVSRLTRGLRQVFPHSWTADGKAVLVESDPEKGAAGKPSRNIYRQPIDGTNPTLVASLTGAAALPQLSPDGRWILFLEFSSSTHRPSIFRVPADGGKVERVPTSGEVEEFRCSASPAGRCVVREAVGNEQFVYYDFDPVTGMGKELRRTAWQPNLLGDWGLSADGNMVAIASHDTLHPHVDLLHLRGEDSPMQRVALEGHGTALGVGWATEGTALFVECQTKTGYELVWLGLNGRARVLRKSPKQIWAVPSRDGRRISFPAVTYSSGVWISGDRP